MQQMQLEMFHKHQRMLKDKDGFPKLKISFQGIVHIVVDKEQEDWERSFDRKAMVVGFIICLVIFSAIFSVVANA